MDNIYMFPDQLHYKARLHSFKRWNPTIYTAVPMWARAGFFYRLVKIYQPVVFHVGLK